MAGFTVIRVRRSPGGHDDNGDAIASAETRQALHSCALAPRTEREPSERGRNGAVIGLTLYAPIDTDLVGTDLVQIDPGDPDDLYEIEGEVGRWINPFVPSHGGIEAALKRATG